MRKIDKIMEMYGLHSADLAAEPLKMNDPEYLKQKVYAYFGDREKFHYIDDMGSSLKRFQQQVKNGTKFKMVYGSTGQDEYVYTEEPKEGYSPALIPVDEE